MSILSVKNVFKSYGVESILENISFNLEKGEKVGILGGNGAGKTTLLKLIAGDIFPDEGEITGSKDLNVGYLRQTDKLSDDFTVIEAGENVFKELIEKERELIRISEDLSRINHDGDEYKNMLVDYERRQHEFREKGGYTYKSKVKGVLKSMAFKEEDRNKKIKFLSGGERTRLALGCLLLEEPDILLLDEPTNHLDIGTVKWLEQYISNYRGTVLLVTHDRYFLDKTINRILYIEHKKLKSYRGDYSSCAEMRKQERQISEKQYEKKQKLIAKEEDLIRRFKERGTEKLAKRAKSREKRLSAMEEVQLPSPERRTVSMAFKQTFKSGKDVLKIEGLSKSFGRDSSKTFLFKNVDMALKRGERVCILGANGIGKTTFLKLILGEMTPDQGTIQRGHNVKIAYYDQKQEFLNPDYNLIEILQDQYGLYSEGELRKFLGAFLFHGDDVFLKVKELSGGEKARLSLLKVMMSGANLLIMDEPTNHLDIESKEVFEDAMINFEGTAIIVSHDRYFLSRVPHRILELTDRGFLSFLGKYDYYEEKSKEITSGKRYLEDMRGKEAKSENSNSQEERRKKKEEEARKRRLERENKELERKIEVLEKTKKSIEEKMCMPENSTNHSMLEGLAGELKDVTKELEKIYEKWLQTDRG